jgi:hypothetical protein
MPSEEIARKLMEMSGEELFKFIEERPGELMQAVRALGAVAERAAWLSAYISRRIAPCDQGEGKALKHAQKVLKKVRKALGYNKP